MAARVNTRFVVLLGAVLLVLVAGIAYLGREAIRKSGDDYVKLGDSAMAENKYEEAVAFYAKAVFKDQKNAGWIRKWMAAMQKNIPKGRAVYLENYQKQYMLALRSLPEADRGDVEAHRRYLDEIFGQSKIDRNVIPAMESMIRVTDEMLKNYNGPEQAGKVLLRYRALPKMALLTRNPDNKPQDYAQTRKDLEDVLSVDPTDVECVLSLAQIDASLSTRARKQGEVEEADKLLAAAKDRLKKYVADHPPAAKVRLAMLSQEAASAVQESTRPISVAEVIGDRKPQVQELMDALKTEDPAKAEAQVVATAFTYALIALPPQEGRAQIDQISERILAARPDDAAMLMSIAKTDLLRGDGDKAVARLQMIVDMKDKPMSLDGYLLFGQRIDATLGQAEAVFAQWEREKDPAKRDQLADRARKLRESLVDLVGDAAPEVLSLDAKLAYIAGDQNGARTLITRYNDITGQKDPKAMALLGDLLYAQGNTGAARQTYQRVLALEPSNARTMLALANLELKAQDLEAAQPYLEALAKMDPENEGIKERVKAVKEALEKSPKDTTSRRLKEIQDTASGVGADLPRAIQMAEELFKTKKDDMRVYTALAYLYNRSGQRDKVIQTLDLAIEQFPDDQGLKEVRKNIASDPVELEAEQIRKAENISELEKAKRLYRVFKRFGQNDKAKNPFDDMVRLAPDDPFVADCRFSEYAAAGDSKGMSEVVALAEAKNLDQLNGTLFRARQQLVEKKFTEAIQSLRAALERDKLNQPAWRMLGSALLETQDYAGAAEALAKAVEIRPDDVPSVNGLLRSLWQIGNQTEALAQARKSEKVAAGDPEFDELLLQLESEVAGGDKAKAATVRERIAKRDPSNKGNAVQLIAIKLEQRKYDEAKSMIDGLKADPDERVKAVVAELEALWFAQQGKFAETEKVYDDYIAALPADKKSVRPYIAAGVTFQRVKRPDLAVAYLEKGRAVESKDMRIAREIGDVNFGMNKPAEAVVEYKKVLDSGQPDEGSAVAKRILECYVRMKDWAKFDEMLAGLGQAAQKDATLLLLAAEAAVQQGDPSRAAKLYGQAVAADSKNPMVFMKRGEFLAKDPAKERDAVADYEQAAKLAPGATLPLKQITLLYKAHGKPEKAVEVLRRALDIDPADDGIRSEMVNLKLDLGDDITATALLDEAIKNKPESIAWMMEAGKIMTRIGQPDKASQYYGKAWELKKALDVAVPYVTTLIAKTPADTATAWKVANDKAFGANEEVATRLLKAMVLQKSERKQAEAYDELEKAYLKIDPADASMCQLFSSGIESTYPDNNRDQLAAWGKLNSKKELTKWMFILANLSRLREDATRAKAADDVLAYIEKQDDASMKLSVYQLMASYFYQVKDFGRSVEMYNKFLELEPNNAEAQNNIAFILASELKKPSEALPHAQRAVELAPKSPNALDTLGVCQLGVPDLENAEKTLMRALDASRSDNDRVPSMLHLAQAKKAKGDRAGAQQVLQDVKAIFDSSPSLKKQYEKEYKELSDQIGSN